MSDTKHRAKEQLRRAREGNLTGVAQPIALATDQIGRPLTVIPEGHEPDPGATVTLRLQALSLTGTLLPLTEGDKEEQARFDVYHPTLSKAPLWRMQIHGAVFEDVDVPAEDLMSPDLPDLARREAGAVAHMNEDHADAVELYATHYLNLPEGDWVLQGLDPEGLDMALDRRTARLWFDPPLTGAGDMGPRLVQLAKSARAESEAD